MGNKWQTEQVSSWFIQAALVQFRAMVDFGKPSFLRPFRVYRFILLAGLIWLAFGLRLVNLDAFSFWTDESLTPLRASYSLARILRNEIIIQGVVTQDTHPPLFYVFTHFTRLLFGETDFAYRYPAVLWGVLLIPLLVQFGRRMGGRPLGMVAGLLTAVNPLLIWYANEARMYPQAIFLAAAASYALWRALSRKRLSSRQFRRYLFLYLLLVGAAVYTHYTAFFLVGFQAIFWVWLLWRRGNKQLIVGATVLALLITIPALPIIVPRLFAGAEANYFYVSPWIMLQDVVHGFNLGITIDFNFLSTKLLDVGALILLLVGLYQAHGRQARLFLITYLLAIVLGLMAGSALIKPMYQGVRHIILGSSAFYLLVAWGIVGNVNVPNMSMSQKIQKSIFLIGGLGIMLTGAAVSLHNLYFDPSYAKNDFRGLIAFIEERAGENDIVLYNNAIHLPMHDHYQRRPDVSYDASPVYPTQAAEAGPQLAYLAQSYDRIWFVTDPPADKRDTNHLVQQWLDKHLTRLFSYSGHGRTTVVEVIAYDTISSTEDALSVIGKPRNILWEGLPPLRGVRPDIIQPTRLPAIWFDLFWENTGQAYQAQKLLFSLRGPDGHEFATGNGELPDMSLATGKLARRSYHLPLPWGIPPGKHTLMVSPGDGRPAQFEPVIDIEIGPSNEWLLEPKRPSTTPALHFQNGLTLLGAAIPGLEVRPGHNLPLTLYWQTNAPLEQNRMKYFIEILDPNGQLLKEQEGVPGGGLSNWPVGTPILEDTGLYFHPKTEPGIYQVRWQVWEEDELQKGRPSWRPWYSEFNILASIEVKPWPLNTELPDIDEGNVLQAHFGSAIDLFGYELKRQSETIKVTLYWQANSPPDGDYFSFVHLTTADGTIVSQAAFVPVTGLRPISGWRSGEILVDPYTLTLPSDLPSGDYTLFVGLFDPETGIRPAVTYQGQSQVNNQMMLETITLP